MNEKEPEEWDTPAQGEDIRIDPEHQEGLRRLLTELIFCGAGAPVLGFTGAWLHDPVTPPWARSASPPLWKVIVYEWLPPLMWLLVSLVSSGPSPSR